MPTKKARTEWLPSIGFYNHRYDNAPFSVWGWIFEQNGFDVVYSPRSCLCELKDKKLHLPNIVVVSPVSPRSLNAKAYKDFPEYQKMGIEYCWEKIGRVIEANLSRSFFVEIYSHYQGLENRMREVIGERPNLCYFDTTEFKEVEEQGRVFRFDFMDFRRKMKDILDRHCPENTTVGSLAERVLKSA